MVLNKVSKKEAEIASSAEYLWKDSGFSIVNQTNLTVRLQVFRERRTHTLRKIVWKKKAWASDEVTSPSSLFNRVLCSRECDRSALETYLWHQSVPNFIQFTFFRRQSHFFRRGGVFFRRQRYFFRRQPQKVRLRFFGTMKSGIFNINHCLFCFIVSVITNFKEWS